MPLIQGGPPEWIWERTPDPLRSEIIPTRNPQGDPVYELRVSCGLGIMRLQFFTEDECRQLQSALREQFADLAEVEIEFGPLKQRFRYPWARNPGDQFVAALRI